MTPEEKYFELALEQAERAAERGEVPIGAVLVMNDDVLIAEHNRTEEHHSFTAHAEMLCLRQASRKIEQKYLNGARLFVTLEPCLMCQTAARLSRVVSIHYLARSEKFGNDGPAYGEIALCESPGAQSQRAVTLLRSFFEKRR